MCDYSELPLFSRSVLIDYDFFFSELASVLYHCAQNFVFIIRLVLGHIPQEHRCSLWF